MSVSQSKFGVWRPLRATFNRTCHGLGLDDYTSFVKKTFEDFDSFSKVGVSKIDF